VDSDPHRPFSMGQHDAAMGGARDYIDARPAYLDSWLACRSGGGADHDGDGFAWCRECDDNDAATKPGAVETCNLRDDNCDGRVDNVGVDQTCQ
jgi:hypothetical protein